VFQGDGFEAVRDAVGVAGLTGVQLHGGCGRTLPRLLREEFGDELTIAQTLHWVVGGEDGSPVAGLVEQVRELAGEGLVDRVLVDSKVGAALGGTGTIFDWDAAGPLFEQTGDVRMIVAGGLNPENVGEAIGRLRPWGVDVASGVEMKPGRKDPERLRLFIERARAEGMPDF
jgi:phosphoribosylanthranilate isomerase